MLGMTREYEYKTPDAVLIVRSEANSMHLCSFMPCELLLSFPKLLFAIIHFNVLV